MSADAAAMDTTTRDSSGPRDAAVTSSWDHEDDESCRLFEFVVCSVLIGAFCVFGLVGNVASFVVFCRQHKTTTATTCRDHKTTAASAVLLLQCMAVCDSLLLLVALVVYSLPAVYAYTGQLRVIHDTFDYIVYVVWPPAMILHTVTVWLTVLVSVNRYNAVCRAVEEFGTTTMLRRTRVHVVIVVILSVLYNVPRFFEHQASYGCVVHALDLCHCTSVLLCILACSRTTS